MSEESVVKFKESVMAPIKKELERLKQYDLLKTDLLRIDNLSGPFYMREFNSAFMLASAMVSSLKEKCSQAKLEMDHQEAKAKLERAPKYFEENKTLNSSLKDSGALRDTYVKLDEVYLLAAERYNVLEAVLAYFTKLQESYKMAHDDAKKIYAGIIDSPANRGEYQGIPSSEEDK
jgi:hypothetical protein